MTFDQVRVYEPEKPSKKAAKGEKLAIVTYGNGVVTALQARYSRNICSCMD